jgi:N-acetylglucosamine-6-phosphate deacetylase
MTPIHHREFGVAGWGLSKDEITFDIIADGIHIADEMLRFTCRAKTTEKVSLISDSVSPTGLGDGEFEIWNEKISVKNRRTQNSRGSIAGSVITMQDAVRKMLALGFSENEVSRMASANPARLLRIENERGTIEVGKRADLVALDEQGNVALTIIGGRIAFTKNAA